MTSAAYEETDLRTQLKADSQAAFAYELISQLSHCAAAWRCVPSPGQIESVQVETVEWARVHSLAAHVIDTLAPRLRGGR